MEVRECPDYRSAFPILAEACPQHGPTRVDVHGMHPMLGQWIADPILSLELLVRRGMGDAFVAWQAIATLPPPNSPPNHLTVTAKFP